MTAACSWCGDDPAAHTPLELQVCADKAERFTGDVAARYAADSAPAVTR